MVMTPAETETKNCCVSEDQQQFTGPIDPTGIAKNKGELVRLGLRWKVNIIIGWKETVCENIG
jgi:hypothetical protein